MRTHLWRYRCAAAVARKTLNSSMPWYGCWVFGSKYLAGFPETTQRATRGGGGAFELIAQGTRSTPLNSTVRRSARLPSSPVRALSTVRTIGPVYTTFCLTALRLVSSSRCMSSLSRRRLYTSVTAASASRSACVSTTSGSFFRFLRFSMAARALASASATAAARALSATPSPSLWSRTAAASTSTAPAGTPANASASTSIAAASGARQTPDSDTTSTRATPSGRAADAPSSSSLPARRR
mmetsp:Transcript_6199/g.24848  ORF Transcript_6199/g.24848 Transcript_6199/m.24848 type:complete len:240 (-) Transcript_6199:82-801(-)